MASSTKNVKIGVCRITYKGVDLGYTKGGVEVNVTTETHEVKIDQFGETPIGERIRGRKVMVTCPLAETTLENLVTTMPGSTLFTDGVYATGSLTVATNFADSETVVINGRTVTAATVPAGNLQFLIGGSTAATAANLAAFIAGSNDYALRSLTAVAVGSAVNISYGTRGVAGNAITLATGTAGASATVSGATLSGGVDVTAARVDVPTSVGLDMLSIAGPLVLHPQDLPTSDQSEDFTIPLAATAGALQFSYQTDNERVYNVEFKGYPDETSGDILFSFGDPDAV